MGPGALAQVLQPLTRHTHPDLIVGLQTSDDAAVYRLSEELAIIQTVDFFPPVVDDPFTFGAIAAANSLSDIYAMGGEVLFALNVVCYPDNLPLEILTEILAGGASKVTEAGAVIAGGHTVTDKEPKYGLTVTGVIDPRRIWRKSGAQPDDRLFLTKPIGTGLITTAAKNDAVDIAHLDAAITSMLTLNRAAASEARNHDIHAASDITGFGLLGHAFEMADKGQTRFVIDANRIPLLPGTVDYVRSKQVPGGQTRNREYYSRHGVTCSASVDRDLVQVLYGPETSGGLLLAVGESSANALAIGFASAGLPLWEIGRAEPGSGVRVE